MFFRLTFLVKRKFEKRTVAKATIKFDIPVVFVLGNMYYNIGGKQRQKGKLTFF